MLKILRSLGFAGEKNISGYSLVPSLYESIEFSSITFPKNEKKIIVWFLSLNRILQISQSVKNTQHQASQKWTIHQSYWLLAFNYQNSIHKQPFKAKKLQRM